MKKANSKRLLTLVLVVVLVFALSVSAFATWSSFQGNQKNNGTISTQPAITSSATATPVQLAINNPDGSVFTGIDAASVIQGNYAFTLYNGGVSGANDVGGARMQATNVTNGSTLWNIQLDAAASNSMQLSTPYYDSSNNVIYAAVTYTTAFQTYTSVDGWTASGGASIDNDGIATFTGGNQSISNNNLSLSSAVGTIQLFTDLALSNNAAGSYTITLSDNNSSATYTLASGEASADWYGTYATYNGAAIPVGSYTLTFTLNSLSGNNATATLSTVTMSRYDWRLYSISSVLTKNPVKSGILAYGEGQINTHINSIGNYLFFGGFGGEHAYYQYGPINSTASLKKFIPGSGNDFDDFYYAGASKYIDSDDTTNVVFGSESGKIYVRPVGGDFDDLTAGSIINLASTQSACGPIRSSICVVGSDWYVTSRGPLPSEIDPDDPDAPEPKGYLWKITSGTTVNLPLQLPGNSTSTPVVSSNNFVYVGYYISYTGGGVIAVPTSFTSSTVLKTVYSGAPVQCSPIVYSIASGAQSSRIDYIYFATDAVDGAGYCYSMTKSNQTVSPVWTAGGTSSNRYALQGFSSENGYLVYGDDGNYLYIVH